MSQDTVFVSVPVDAIKEQLRCPWCHAVATAFGRPALGEPWRVQCPNRHAYSVKVDLGGAR